MANYFTDNGPKAFYLEPTRMKQLIALREGDDADADALLDFYMKKLDEVGRIAAERIAPRAASVDDDSAQWHPDGSVTYAPGTVENLKDLTDAGLMGVTLPKKYGGPHIPVTVYSMMTEMVSRADASLQNLFGLQEIAETIHKFGSEDQKQRLLPGFASGELDGAMALTEPEAGSDLQSATTSATQDDQGVWRINGLKHFITNGCAKVMLVLARSEEGTKDGRGLSMFIVRKCPEVVINRIENKMGIHGSPVCEVQFNNAPAELVGQRRFGLIKYVMSLMNGARLAISSQAAGLSEAAYTLAREYTSTRIQFKKPLAEIPAVTDMLDRMGALAEAERTLLYETCYYVDMRDAYQELADKPDASAETRASAKYYARIASLMTPITKFFNTEAANAIAYDTIQCMGGKGYMHERIAERYYRDARIMNIYEGTSQMQVVAASGNVFTHTINPILDDLFAETADVLPALTERLKAAKAITDDAIDRVAASPLAERLARRVVRMISLIYVTLLMLRNAKRDPARLDAVKVFAREFLPEIAMNKEVIDEFLAQ